MSIANFKARVVSIAQGGPGNEISISKRLEAISSNLKSTPTIIARDLKIDGELTGSGLVEIEGHVKGTIKGNMVVLREDGFIEGTVFAESFNIRGKFEGNIRSKSISIASKARVTGDIEYGSLSVEDGACIDGQFKHIGNGK